MEVFELRWPKTSATLCTDGWRCRVVWRTPNGMGGVIDNTELAKRRVAGGLYCAPELLEDLRASGHAQLAEEIEAMADPADLTEPADLSERADPGPEIQEEPRFTQWLDNLSGSQDWEACGNRRAKAWVCLASVSCGSAPDTWTEVLYLKAPNAKGKQEWVLKRVWPDPTPDGEKIDPQYVTAGGLKGVFAYLAGIPEHEHDAFFAKVVEGLEQVAEGSEEARKAILAWERLSSPMH